MTDIFTQLAERMPVDSIKFRKGSANRDKSKNRVLAYVDARDIQNRLDAVVGPANWQDKYIRFDGGFICELSIRFEGEWITKSGVGEDKGDITEDNAQKSAESDALKRAAVKFGIARHLYTDSISPMWVEKSVPDWEVTATLQSTNSESQSTVPQPAPKPARGNLSPAEVKELDRLLVNAYPDDAEREEKTQLLLQTYNCLFLRDIPSNRYEKIKARLVDVAIERIETTTAAAPALPPPLSVDRQNRIRQAIVKTYGDAYLQKYLRILVYDKYGVDTLAKLTVDQYGEALSAAQQAHPYTPPTPATGDGQQPLVDTKSAPFKAFMADGNKTYGQMWDVERKRIIGVVTDGRTASAKELYVNELGAAREMLKREFDEMAGVAEKAVES